MNTHSDDNPKGSNESLPNTQESLPIPQGAEPDKTLVTDATLETGTRLETGPATGIEKISGLADRRVENVPLAPVATASPNQSATFTISPTNTPTNTPTQIRKQGRSGFIYQAGFLMVMLAGIFYLLQVSTSRNEIRNVDATVLKTSARATIEDSLPELDQQFIESWAEAGIAKTPQAGESLLMRRMALALTGTPPSLEQLRWVQQIPEEKRLDQFLAHLLQDRSSHEYLAEQLSRSWIGTENGPFVVFRRRRFVDWLADELGKNRPYDELVSSMLTARGLWTDNGAVNFYTAQCDQENENQLDTIRLTGKISRCFLGMRLDCLQCHDDFTGTTEVAPEGEPREGRQTDFHAIASFFGQTTISPTGVHDDTTRPTYSVELLGDSEPSDVPASVPFGSAWSPGTMHDQRLSQDEVLRQQFANWLTRKENRPFARSMVNRTWGLLFGKPMTQPIDDIPLNGPFPPGLEVLTDDFIQHDYNIQRLISLIVNSEAFRRDSRSQSPLSPQHEHLWASFPLTKIRPEQMAGTISQAASLSRLDDSSHILVQLVRFGEQNNFLTRFGDLGDDEFKKVSETVSQRLLLFNGEMINERLGSGGLPFNSVAELNRLSPDNPTLVTTLYNIVLTRDPTENELEYFLPKFDLDRRSAIEDTFWVLVNSSESLWNH